MVLQALVGRKPAERGRKTGPHWTIIDGGFRGTRKGHQQDGGSAGGNERPVAGDPDLRIGQGHEPLPTEKRSTHRRQLFIRCSGHHDRLDNRISLGGFHIAQWLFS